MESNSGLCWDRSYFISLTVTWRRQWGAQPLSSQLTLTWSDQWMPSSLGLTHREAGLSEWADRSCVKASGQMQGPEQGWESPCEGMCWGQWGRGGALQVRPWVLEGSELSPRPEANSILGHTDRITTTRAGEWGYPSLFGISQIDTAFGFEFPAQEHR